MGGKPHSKRLRPRTEPLKPWPGNVGPSMLEMLLLIIEMLHDPCVFVYTYIYIYTYVCICICIHRYRYRYRYRYMYMYMYYSTLYTARIPGVQGHVGCIIRCLALRLPVVIAKFAGPDTTKLFLPARPFREATPHPAHWQERQSLGLRRKAIDNAVQASDSYIHYGLVSVTLSSSRNHCLCIFVYGGRQ